MFGEGAMWDDYGNNNDEKNKEETPEKLVVDVDIPLIKSEPMSPTRSISYESLQDGIMPSHLPIVTPCKLKEPIIILERCDKIWKTLQLIKTVQSDDLDNEIDESSKNVDAKNSTIGPEKDVSTYVKYQPMLGNSVLPNFQLSVKSTKKLFHCNVCGKEYSENRSLRAHSQKIHGIFIPPKRKVKPNPNSISNIDLNKSGVKDGKSPVINTRTQAENAVFDKELKGSEGEDRNFDVILQSTNIKTNKNSPQVEKNKNTAITKSGSRAKCPLCKRVVTNLSKHLTEYHKINCPNLIMKELESTVQSQTEITLKDFTKAIVNTTPLPDTATKQVGEKDNKRKHEEAYTMTQEKYKLCKSNTSNAIDTSQNLLMQKRSGTKTYKCDICLGLYASYNSFYKHKHIHRKRGETRDNFDGLRSRYINSPLNGKGIDLLISSKAYTISVPNKRNKEKAKRASLDSMDCVNLQDYESGIYDENGTNSITKKKACSENFDRSCICGRLFRDYHTLVIHKQNCKIRNTIEAEPFMEDNLDRDAGNGINITIKKKNDSYEIVSRDSGDEIKSKDSGHPNDCDTPSDISDFTSDGYNEILYDLQSTNIPESSKYSKDHSILKIQTIDENIDIDVEDDSPTSSLEIVSNNQINEKNENNNIKGVPTLAHLCETIFAEHSKTDDPPALIKIGAKRSSNTGSTTNSSKLENEQSIEAVDTLNLPKITNSTKPSNENSLSSTSMSSSARCPCGVSFRTLKACNAHIAKCHPLFLRCGYCKERFNSITEYTSHTVCNVEKGKMFDKVQAELPCPFCQVVLKSKIEFDQHIHFQHCDEELPYQCYECKEKFPSNSKRYVHFTKMHSKCLCNVCGLKLTASTKLGHEGYHYGLGFPCHICKKTHTNQQNLSNHLRVLHEEDNPKLVKCNICLKLMKAKSLSWHLYSHKTLTMCVLCKKLLCDGRNLEHHIVARHQGKYPWIKCNFCKKRFCNKRLLERHMTREKCKNYISTISKDNALLHS